MYVPFLLFFLSLFLFFETLFTESQMSRDFTGNQLENGDQFHRGDFTPLVLRLAVLYQPPKSAARITKGNIDSLMHQAVEFSLNPLTEHAVRDAV